MTSVADGETVEVGGGSTTIPDESEWRDTIDWIARPDPSCSTGNGWWVNDLNPYRLGSPALASVKATGVETRDRPIPARG
jgi:hypothetical protein